MVRGLSASLSRLASFLNLTKPARTIGSMDRTEMALPRMYVYPENSEENKYYPYEVEGCSDNIIDLISIVQ